VRRENYHICNREELDLAQVKPNIGLLELQKSYMKPKEKVSAGCTPTPILELHFSGVSPTNRFNFVGEPSIQIASPEANHHKGMPKGRNVLV
jgi:hypothetical protein